MTVLLVALGAAVGAPLRYLIDRAIRVRHDSPFPWGTLTANLLGSLLLGFLVGLPATAGVAAAAGVGFCGALTTYSTFSYETLRLTRNGPRFYALANIVTTIAGGIGAAALGFLLAQAATGH